MGSRRIFGPATFRISVSLWSVKSLSPGHRVGGAARRFDAAAARPHRLPRGHEAMNVRLPALGHRMGFLRQSEIRNMTLECTRVSGINMSQGVCDTPVPEVVRRAAQAAIDEGCNTYTRF